MENLSKVRRDKMIQFLETLKEQHSDDESLIAINQIEKELVSKRYGLVWEEHEENVDVMMNHINSYSRLKLGNKTPFEAFEFYYGSELFEKLGYKQVEKNQVIINPKLLKR